MPYNPESDKQVMEYVAGIFDRYGDFVRQVIRAQVADPYAADDIFQDSFLSLLANPPPKDTANMERYLYRAVTNDISNAVRSSQALRKKIERFGSDAVVHISKDDPADACTMEDRLGRMREILRNNLLKCEASAVELSYLDDLGIKGTAKEMDINRRSASRYVCVAIKKLRQILKNPEEQING